MFGSCSVSHRPAHWAPPQRPCAYDASALASSAEPTGTVDQVTQMKTKDLGAAHEIEFSLECIERGATVSQPLGDNAPYDLIVDAAGKLLRVQCKRGGFEEAIDGKPSVGTGTEKWGVNTSKPSTKKAYTPDEIDFIVSKSGGIWYIWAIEKDFPTTIKAYPAGDGSQKWEKGRNKWDALGLPAARLSDAIPAAPAAGGAPVKVEVPAEAPQGENDAPAPGDQGNDNGGGN